MLEQCTWEKIQLICNPEESIRINIWKVRTSILKTGKIWLQLFCVSLIRRSYTLIKPLLFEIKIPRNENSWLFANYLIQVFFRDGNRFRSSTINLLVQHNVCFIVLSAQSFYMNFFVELMIQLNLSKIILSWTDDDAQKNSICME